MRELFVKVTEDMVKVKKDIIQIGTGNVNTIDVIFELPDVFKPLTSVAVFTADDKIYKQNIINNMVKIDYRVLLTEGWKTLGVYAYDTSDELIYSPIVDKFFVEKGSYEPNGEDDEDFNPSDLDRYLEEANKLYLKIKDISDETEFKIQQALDETVKACQMK